MLQFLKSFSQFKYVGLRFRAGWILNKTVQILDAGMPSVCSMQNLFIVACPESRCGLARSARSKTLRQSVYQYK
jgi:hypothetical protein